MCNAITNKGNKCIDKSVFDVQQLKEKYGHLSDEELIQLVQRLCLNESCISSEDETILKYFKYKNHLLTIVLKYIRLFHRGNTYYWYMIQTNFLESWEKIKDEVCSTPTVSRISDKIEWLNCLEELSRLYIIVIIKTNRTISVGRNMLYLIQKYKREFKLLYEEEQLNILRTKEVQNLELLSLDVYKHIFTGYL